MAYKYTLMWNQSVMGVSETYIIPATTDVQATNLINVFLPLRQNIMFDNQFVVGLRVSALNTAGGIVQPSTRQSALCVPGAANFLPGGSGPINLFTAGKQSSAAGTTQPDTLRNALQYRIQYGGSYETSRYLSGIPTAITYTEPQTLVLGGAPGWVAAFNAFRAWLSSNVQIMQQVPATSSNRVPVRGLVNQSTAPTYLGIQVDPGALGSAVQGQKIHLRGFRPPKGTRNPTVNGVWTIQSIVAGSGTTPTIIYLNNSQALTPDMISLRGTPTAQMVQYQLASIDSILPMRVVSHKRGRPSLAPRGRRLTRYTLDP